MAEPNSTTLAQTGVITSGCSMTAPRSWTCKITSGKDTGREFSVGARPVVVGADSSCDFVLTDPTISRKHAELRASPQGIQVVDLGSTNGTFYQSSRITQVILAGDTSIRMGETQLKIFALVPPTLPPSGRTRFGGLVGQSISMREVFAVLELASPTDATILIEGESGTGKELAARAIHDHSNRAEEPFVVVDCSATNEQLINSHLFGHLRGAFTSAVSDRKGAFYEAHNGTLFLDEIGELPLSSQGNLLRAIEAQTIQPLGSDQTISVNTRVIAATNRDLTQMVEDKTFRFDLFHRLAVVHIKIPSLRERLEDLAVLIQYFYEGSGIEPGSIQGENLKKLQEHDWPGNVRELRNVVERLLLFPDRRSLNQ